MSKRIELFRPASPAKLKVSSLYMITMFARAFGVCSRFLARALTSELTPKIVDSYVKDFWQCQFEETRTRLFCEGRELLVPGKTYLYMSNHESWMDIPAMCAAVPGSLRMVSKAGIMQIPIVGAAMQRAGFIGVDRRNRSKAIKQLDKARERLNSGISIWMAPEGTRSRSGELAPFKKGGFHLACSLGLDIVPAFIEGARDVMPPDSLSVVTNSAITVHFCEPISTASYNRSNLDELVASVRNAIIAKRDEVQAIHNDESAL